ncbi:hypothetical protein QVG61_02525 [Thiohalobacter sp. IOR34]|uniref:hypothetical protein n=1 Tax=Thiohalobacter sp. IOR34 TaxID=3057176 RepID=UPI0025AFFB76|nr:hypothetical protein [Thiohalobacter sp. IOR34]WJW75985.1 hypothetical protein QVG61_02525 [Thiohalobacter sp. IOR34]
MKQQSLLNPAWRPASRQPEALERISHHFLGELPAAAAPAERHLPVLIALDANREAAHYTAAARRLLDRLQQKLDQGGAGVPRWRFELQPEPERAEASNLLLLIAHASLPGIRHAYARLKTRPGPPPLAASLLLCGARDDPAARRLYRRLAVGLLRFRDLPLGFLGCLPESRAGDEAELERLGRRLREQADPAHPVYRYRRQPPP